MEGVGGGGGGGGLYLGGGHCPVAKKEAEVAWQRAVLPSSSFLGRTVCVCAENWP